MLKRITKVEVFLEKFDDRIPSVTKETAARMKRIIEKGLTN